MWGKQWLSQNLVWPPFASTTTGHVRHVKWDQPVDEHHRDVGLPLLLDGCSKFCGCGWRWTAWLESLLDLVPQITVWFGSQSVGRSCRCADHTPLMIPSACNLALSCSKTKQSKTTTTTVMVISDPKRQGSGLRHSFSVTVLWLLVHSLDDGTNSSLKTVQICSEKWWRALTAGLCPRCCHRYSVRLFERLPTLILVWFWLSKCACPKDSGAWTRFGQTTVNKKSADSLYNLYKW